MKKALKILVLALVSVSAYAQDERQKVLKINLSAAAMGAATVQYERVLGKHFSLALGAGYRPKSLFPYAKDLEKYINIADDRIDYISFDNVRKADSRVGMYHITPEVRFYFGKKSAPIGTYLAVFGKYNDFRGDVPVFVDTEYRNLPVRLELPVDTEVRTTSIGLMLGRQFRLGKRCTFDWYVVGGHWGKAKVHGESNQNLEGFDEDFRTRLRNRIIETFKIAKHGFS